MFRLPRVYISRRRRAGRVGKKDEKPQPPRDSKREVTEMDTTKTAIVIGLAIVLHSGAALAQSSARGQRYSYRSRYFTGPGFYPTVSPNTRLEVSRTRTRSRERGRTQTRYVDGRGYVTIYGSECRSRRSRGSRDRERSTHRVPYSYYGRSSSYTPQIVKPYEYSYFYTPQHTRYSAYYFPERRSHDRVTRHTSRRHSSKYRHYGTRSPILVYTQPHTASVSYTSPTLSFSFVW